MLPFPPQDIQASREEAQGSLPSSTELKDQPTRQARARATAQQLPYRHQQATTDPIAAGALVAHGIRRAFAERLAFPQADGGHDVQHQSGQLSIWYRATLRPIPERRHAAQVAPAACTRADCMNYSTIG